MNFLYLLIAFISGIIVSVQSAINAKLAEELGGQAILSALISFVIGVIVLIIMAVFQVNWSVAMNNINQPPLWSWSGGVFGAVFVTATVILAPKIGITNMAFLLIVGQLVSGLLIDKFGLFSMEQRPIFWWRYIGLSIMFVGLIFFIFGDKFFK